MKKNTFSFLAIGGGLLLFGISKYVSKISNMPPRKYSSEWIEGLSDGQWKIERDIVWKKFADPEHYDNAARVDFQNLLFLFDKIKSKRDWAGQTPVGPGYSREHGFNLYKED